LICTYSTERSHSGAGDHGANGHTRAHPVSPQDSIEQATRTPTTPPAIPVIARAVIGAGNIHPRTMPMTRTATVTSAASTQRACPATDAQAVRAVPAAGGTVAGAGRNQHVIGATTDVIPATNMSFARMTVTSLCNRTVPVRLRSLVIVVAQMTNAASCPADMSGCTDDMLAAQMTCPSLRRASTLRAKGSWSGGL
jgi:hypothetical protein